MVQFHNIIDGIYHAGDHSNMGGDPANAVLPIADDLTQGDVLYWDDTAFEWRAVEGTKAPGYVLGLDADLRLRWIDIGAVGEPTPDPPPPPPVGDVTEPDAPTGLSAIAGDRQIILNWDDNVEADLASYKVYWAAASGGPFVLLTTRATSDHVVIGLTNGTEYWFKVTALDTTGNESALSDADSATPDLPDPNDVTPPATPTSLEATATDRQVALNWDDSAETDFASYAVYRATQSGGPFVLLTSRTVSSYINSGLTNGTTYYYKVSAVDATGNESAATLEVPATPEIPVDTIPPPIPTGLSAVAGNTTISLNWSDSPASDWANFTVWRSDTSGGTYVLIATRTASDFTDSGLTNGEDYFYKIIATDTAGNPSAFSAIASATPAAPAPGPGPGTADGYPTYADRAVTINPGDDIDTKILSVSAGTIIGFAAGVHLIDTAGKQFAPRNGERLVGEVDGNGVPTSIIRGNWDQTEFGGGLISPFSYASSAAYATNVQFLRLKVERFVASQSQAVLNGGNGWRFHKCYVTDNRHIGISLGHGAIAFGCKVYRNGAMGFKCIPGCNGGIIDTCEVYENNPFDWHTEAGATGEAGGMKFIFQDPINMVVRRSHYHDNHGAGIWIDDCGGGHIIEDNVSELNTGAGIWWEITEGSGFIRRNVSRYNGLAEIYLSNARGLSGNPLIVEDNILFSPPGVGTGTDFSIRLLDDPTRAPRLGHITIRRNKIYRGTISGKVNQAISHYAFASGAIPPGVVINDNDYYTNVTNAWQWSDVSRTWAQWQGLGFDTIGSKSPYQTP